MKALFRYVLIALLAGFQSGCFLWPFGGDGGSEEKPASLVKFEPEAEVRTLWNATIGDGLSDKWLMLSPAVDGTHVFAADAFGVVEARDLQSGRRIWSTRVGRAAGRGLLNFDLFTGSDATFVTGGVAVGSGLVLLGTSQGQVVALDEANGEEVWRAHASSEVVSAPVTNGDVVVAQSVDGQLRALDARTGELRWTYTVQVPILTLRGTASPVIVQDVVLAGFSSGKIAALGAEQGELRWETRVMLPQGRSELERIADVDTTPLVVGRQVFGASFQGRLKSIQLVDGAERWEQEVSTYRDLAQGYGQVYVVNEWDEILAYDVNTSNINWTQRGLRLRRLTSPATYGNYLVVADREGYLHALAQSDGRFVARIKLGAGGFRSDLVAADDVLLALGNKG
ncbi:MAG: outer membrane protein assembly factor BamB, partial [Gammaproteobacteria bacterium]